LYPCAHRKQRRQEFHAFYHSFGKLPEPEHHHRFC
jgi:hypothetical protein